MERTKVYKPEITRCPLCGAKLKYRYTVSNKVIQFSHGEFIRVKNLGYSCTNPDCKDDTVIYSSQTASKLCVKGYTYSAKVLAYITYLKLQHMSREEICDKLAFIGIEVSDRNVDIIYDKYLQRLNMDYKHNIVAEYDYMKRHYGMIRISIDSLIIDDKRVISIRDSFNNNQIGVHFIDRDDNLTCLNILQEYVSDDKIVEITTVRNLTDFFKILEKAVNRPMKYTEFLKY